MKNCSDEWPHTQSEDFNSSVLQPLGVTLHWVLRFPICDNYSNSGESLASTGGLREHVFQQVVQGFACTKITKESLRLETHIVTLLFSSNIICRFQYEYIRVNSVPVMVLPPLYGKLLMALSSSAFLKYWLRLNSVLVSVLYWTTPTLVLSSPRSNALAMAAMKLRMNLKFSRPTLQEPSTRKTRSAMALGEHSGKKSWRVRR